MHRTVGNIAELKVAQAGVTMMLFLNSTEVAMFLSWNKVFKTVRSFTSQSELPRSIYRVLLYMADKLGNILKEKHSNHLKPPLLL